MDNVMDQEMALAPESKRWVRYVSWAVAIIFGALGARVAVQHDIRNSERERELALAEAAVARAEAETLAAHDKALDALHESASHGYCVLDDKGCVTEWNPALEKWTGYSHAEMLGKELLALMAPGKRPKHLAGYAEIINAKKATNKTYVIECEMQPHDPDKAPVMVRVNVRIVSPPNGRRYAVALIDRESRVVELGEKEASR